MSLGKSWPGLCCVVKQARKSVSATGPTIRPLWRGKRWAGEPTIPYPREISRSFTGTFKGVELLPPSNSNSPWKPSSRTRLSAMTTMPHFVSSHFVASVAIWWGEPSTCCVWLLPERLVTPNLCNIVNQIGWASCVCNRNGCYRRLASSHGWRQEVAAAARDSSNGGSNQGAAPTVPSQTQNSTFNY